MKLYMIYSQGSSIVWREIWQKIRQQTSTTDETELNKEV